MLQNLTFHLIAVQSVFWVFVIWEDLFPFLPVMNFIRLFWVFFYKSIPLVKEKVGRLKFAIFYSVHFALVFCCKICHLMCRLKN